MRMTCNLCIAFLIVSSIFGGVYALSGVNVLYFLCFKNEIIFRTLLVQTAVAGLFTIYSMLVFKPFRKLK